MSNGRHAFQPTFAARSATGKSLTGDYPDEGGRNLRRYRYRTRVLAGPWRESPDQALQDAVRARQALIGGAGPRDIRWIVPGEIEEEVPVRRKR